MKKIKINFLIIILIGMFFTISPCLAATSIVDTSNPGYADGSYSLTDVRNYAVYIMNLILSFVGIISLLLFVYGGVTFLLSAGNQNSVKKGTEIIKAAVIGLVLVFSSVLIINLFFGGLGVKWNQTTGAVTSK